MLKIRLKEVLKQSALPAAVFITGACVLVIETVATRALSPFFGNTIFTFSSVISVILVALSAGYYAGGKLADKQPSLKLFFGIIAASGAVLLAFYLLSVFALPFLSAALPLTTGPLISSSLLFLAPAFLLGLLSPFAVKLQSARFPEQGVGSVAGTMFFWSTLGSIGGSLLTGFVLIPHLGVDKIFTATGIILCLLGIIPFALMSKKDRRLPSAFVMVLVPAIFALSAAGQTWNGAVYAVDGLYEKIVIFDGEYEGRPARFFQQDRSSSGAMFLDSSDPTDLAYEYTKYYSLYKIFNPNAERALVIGGGAYSIPKALLAELPESVIEVAEIEPSLFSLAKEYFGLTDDKRLVNHVEDGRRLLAESDEKYDIIFGDAYHSLYSIPQHLTTLEFFKLAKSRMTDGGTFIINVIGDISPEAPSMTWSEIKTFRTVFPNSYFFASRNPDNTEAQNIIFIGVNGDKEVDFNSEEIAESGNKIIASLSEKRIDLSRVDFSEHVTLTDNYAPVEYLTSRVLKREIGAN